MYHEVTSKIGIVIPTMNRASFLKRALKYYARTGFKGPIYIGDSSDATHLQETQKTIKDVRNQLQIIYKEYPGLTEPQTTFQLVAQLSTPYAAFVSDDDFLIPDGLVQCVSFLERAPSYSLCSGQALLVDYSGLDFKVGPYGVHRNLSFQKAQARFEDYAKCYFVNAFSIHRTEQMKEAYHKVDVLPDKGFTEILPSFASVLQGKVKKLNCLSLVRQHHETRYFLPDVYDWITSPNWYPSQEIFVDRLSSLLSIHDGISRDEATRIIKKGFWCFLARSLNHKYESYNQLKLNELKYKFKYLAKKVPYFKTFWEQLYSFTPRGKMTLPALQRSTSPYHNEWMPIYEALISPNNH